PEDRPTKETSEIHVRRGAATAPSLLLNNPPPRASRRAVARHPPPRWPRETPVRRLEGAETEVLTVHRPRVRTLAGACRDNARASADCCRGGQSPDSALYTSGTL